MKRRKCNYKNHKMRAPTPKFLLLSEIDVSSGEEQLKLIPENNQFVTALRIMNIFKIETVYYLYDMDTIWNACDEMKSWNTKQVMVFVCLWHSLYGYRTSKLLSLHRNCQTGKSIHETHYSNASVIISTDGSVEVNILNKFDENTTNHGNLIDWISQNRHNDYALNTVDIQGVFSLKHLVMFTKCSNLASTVFIYLRNNYPIICQYSVASLGEIKLCLAPTRTAT